MIVEKINESIAASTGLNEKAMQLFGLADPVILRDKNCDATFPVIIDADGECHDVLLDDAFDMSLFHRLNAKAYTTAQQTASKVTAMTRNVCACMICLCSCPANAMPLMCTVWNTYALQRLKARGRGMRQLKSRKPISTGFVFS